MRRREHLQSWCMGSLSPFCFPFWSNSAHTWILKVGDGRLSRITNLNRKMGSITKLCAIQRWKLCVELTVRTLDMGKLNVCKGFKCWNALDMEAVIRRCSVTWLCGLMWANSWCFSGFDDVKCSSRFRHWNLGECLSELTHEVFELTVSFLCPSGDAEIGLLSGLLLSSSICSHTNLGA